MYIDDLKLKTSSFVEVAMNCVIGFIIGALLLSFWDKDKLACLCLWAALLALIARCLGKIFYATYLMRGQHQFLRIFIASCYLAILGGALYILYDLVTKYGNDVLYNFDLNHILNSFCELVKKLKK